MENNKLKIRSTFQDIALISTTLTPLLYINGKSFYEGYLHGWKIPTELFPLSFEDALVNGTYAYSFLIAKPISYLFLTSIITHICIILFDDLSGTKTYKKLSQLLCSTTQDINETNQPKENKKIDIAIKISRYFMAISFVSIFLFLSFILLQSKSYQKGNQWAIEKKTKILMELKSEKKIFYPKIILSNKSNITTNFYGYIVRSSSTNYAILSVEELLIIPINQVMHLTIQNKK